MVARPAVEVGAGGDGHDLVPCHPASERVRSGTQIAELGLIGPQRLDGRGIVGGAEDAERHAERFREVAREGVEAGEHVPLVLRADHGEAEFAKLTPPILLLRERRDRQAGSRNEEAAARQAVGHGFRLPIEDAVA